MAARPHTVEFGCALSRVDLPDGGDLPQVNTLRRYLTRTHAQDCRCGGDHYIRVRRQASGGWWLSVTCAPGGPVYKTRTGEARLMIRRPGQRTEEQ